MMTNCRIQWLGAFAGLMVLCGSLNAQTLLDKGYRQMYNLQFPEAHRTFAEYQRAQPNDPLGAVSDAAAYLFDEFERLDILRAEFALKDENFFSSARALPADPALKRSFEAVLAKTERLASDGMHQQQPDPNAMYANVLRLGLHADYLALIEKRELPALSEIKQARQQADRLLAVRPDYYDAYIAVGLENYLLSLKPAPIRWILHATGSQTDRPTGIEKLHLTADKGRYLAPYARMLLSVAALRDHDVTSARRGLEGLAKEFPGNRLYREELARLNSN